MTKKEGYISDFPRKRSGEEGEEEIRSEEGFAGNISNPQGPVNRMPGVGKDKGKGPDSKYLKQFIDSIREREQEEDEKKNNKKEAPKE